MYICKFVCLKNTPNNIYCVIGCYRIVLEAKCDRLF